MEFNKLPNNSGEVQKRRTEFELEYEKTAYNAHGLIQLGKERYGKENPTVDDALGLRSRQDDNNVEGLRRCIAIEIKGKPSNIETDAGKKMAVYKEQYNKLSQDLQKQCPWETIKKRLLANNGYYLIRARNLNEGGILFGVDTEGNPLFADGGEEPIMTDMTYSNTRNRVLYEYEGADIKKDEEEKPVETGYEMFPYSGEYDKSKEIEMFEAATGKPFIKSEDGNNGRGSWLESGNTPSWPRGAGFLPDYGCARVGSDSPKVRSPFRGVRRLLRVREL